MYKYYLHDGENQLGPFSVEELKRRNISRSEYVWKEGLEDWIRAGELDELKELFTTAPPAFKITESSSHKSAPSKDVNSINVGKSSWLGRTKWFVLVALLAIIAVVIYDKNASGSSESDPFNPTIREKTPEELRAELKLKEETHPEQYIIANITTRENWIGETVIEGSVNNTATVAVFKDVVIEMSFISKTGSIIGIKNFTVYEIINPQQNVGIKKIKIFAPGETKSFSVRVVSARSN